jgi:hypothetical protein
MVNEPHLGELKKITSGQNEMPQQSMAMIHTCYELIEWKISQLQKNLMSKSQNNIYSPELQAHVTVPAS